MTYSELKDRFANHPTLQILKERQAPLILGFLSESFKENRMGVVTREELQLSLAIYLEELEDAVWDEDASEDLTINAGALLDLWCSEKKRYLRRYANDQGVIVHELTSYSEKALRWLEDLEPREFIGAESRFSTIYNGLKDLVEGTQVDPEKRLAKLNEKRNEVNREIRELKESGEIKVYEDWQVKERFEEISRSARDLLSDFKQVEDNFKTITRRLFESEMDRQMNRGAILQLALDASDEMKNTPQGKSFAAFWHFLMADFGKDEINALVSSVYDLVEEDEDLKGDAFLRELKFYLHQAGMKILETNHKTAEKLNRILSDNQFSQMHKIRNDILDIKGTILKLGEQLPVNSEFMALDGQTDIILPMERPLSLPKEEIVFKEPEDGEAEKTDLSVLFDPWYVDPFVIKRNIREAMDGASSVRLSEVLKRFPPAKGLGEILAYLEAASRSRSARILEEEEQVVSYVIEGTKKTLSIPEVVYAK